MMEIGVYTPQSVVRAASLGLPMALAIIGGAPERFASFVQLYRETARKSGHDPSKLPVSINSHAYIAEDSSRAADEFFPPYAHVMTNIQHSIFGHQRFLAQMSVGTMPHTGVMNSIELLGTKVAPVVGMERSSSAPLARVGTAGQ